ncbi:MAG: response regulator [Chloroflexi bacterium]|nr:response regulator [Chloroflexota bacterium]
MSQISPLLLLRNGIAAAKAGNRVQARQDLTRVTELDPKNDLAWLWLASIAESLEGSRNCLQRAIEINPANAQAVKGLEMIQARIAQATPSSRCPFCHAVLQQKEQCLQCHMILSLGKIDQVLSNSSVDESRIRTTLVSYQTAVRTNPNDFQAHYHLGLAYLNLKQLDQGLYHLQQAQQIHSEDIELKRQVDWLVQRQVAAQLTNKHSAARKAPSQKKILVIDDSPTICKLVAITLEKHGYHVVSAPDGLDGLAKINDTQPNLILLDITMPRMDGYQLCRIVKGNPETQNIPVIMLSGKDGFFDKVRGRAVGAASYITKPFEPDTLLQTVRKYVDSENVSNIQSENKQTQEPIKRMRSTT